MESLTDWFDFLNSSLSWNRLSRHSHITALRTLAQGVFDDD
jgi:hypothetical protein